MKQSQSTKRRAAGIASAKVVIASATLAATLGGWALISATADPATGLAASAVDLSTPTPLYAAPTLAPTLAPTISVPLAASSAPSTDAPSQIQATTEPTATPEPTATTEPTSAPVPSARQPRVRTRSSR